MQDDANPVTDLRRMSGEELAKLGRRACATTSRRRRWWRITSTRRSPSLGWRRCCPIPECLRYPTRLVFEFGEMAAHQFADAGADLRDPEQNGRVLYLRPLLRDRPDLAVLAVAYMIPVLNYGDIVTDDQCIRYGATLLGMMEEEFYDAICRMADYVGAEPKGPTDAALPGVSPK